MSEPIELRPGTGTVDFGLTDRVAIITGGSRGLGRAMALAFADHGADVVIASRKLDACEALATEITERSGRRALGVAYHAGTWDDQQRLLDTTLETFGRVDVVVNNAGMSPLYRSLTEVTEELWNKVIDVNLKGPFRLSSLAGEWMVANGGGSIINVSSVAAVAPTPAEIPYGAAKSGVQNLTLGLARALAPAVRVNCLMPGAFLTDIAKAWDLDAFGAMAEQRIPLGRGGEPDEIVGATLWLASDAASYTTGSIIKVDGGMVYPSA